MRATQNTSITNMIYIYIVKDRTGVQVARREQERTLKVEIIYTGSVECPAKDVGTAFKLRIVQP